MHKVSLAEARRMVLETEREASQTVTAQIMRTSLHRFRSELTHDAFSMKPCACCTHGFPANDLKSVRVPVFPLHTLDELPDLRDWLALA